MRSFPSYFGVFPCFLLLEGIPVINGDARNISDAEVLRWLPAKDIADLAHQYRSLRTTPWRRTTDAPRSGGCQPHSFPNRQGLSVKEQVLPDDIFTSLDYELFQDKVMYVYDDNENLVKLTLDDTGNDEDGDDGDIASRVSFFLYNKDNVNDPKPLYVNDEAALKNSNFDPAKPTRFITHGWTDSGKSPVCTLIRDAYLGHKDYNVIVIDWSSISRRPYIWASKRVPLIGQFVATMINFLVKHGMDSSHTVLVGHSLGAHIVGIAARYADSDISYVVGLDPALPGFSRAGPGSRISIGDAKYVEIIHTNGGRLGFFTAIGDVDYYPNGGKRQPGCRVDPAGACSHDLAFKYFAESINSEVGFHGKRCTSFRRFITGLCKNSHTSIMGGHKPLFSAHDTYYLNTNPSSPFAKGPLAMRR
ncbi:pancreatic triacylglycerol lipase-like isoform X3 [Temnothorax americanus]|uniref:pancreatic triacylglycerol lipase-like isoform X3 n=1 Tax=Temnothorax americanus TaxID=1964332 RepID=UPI00406774DE